MRIRLCFFSWVILMMVLGLTPAHAELAVDINQGTFKPIPMAFVPFSVTQGQDATLAENIRRVITADLDSTGLIDPVNQMAFPEDLDVFERVPDFASWRAVSVQLILTGKVERTSTSAIKVHFKLYDALRSETLLYLSLTTPVDNWRRLAHLIADQIYERITGESGYFDSRIAFVAESGPPKRVQKRLAVVDSDGENLRYLSDGRNLVLTPRFSPKEPIITYLEYKGNGTPQVYFHHIDTGRKEILGQFPGMTFAPRFAPDGKTLAFSMEVGGNSDVYKYDIRSRQKTRLTNHPGIDTSPSFSPDGSKIVFNSDRGGTQQLYIMSANGGPAERITFGEGRYTTPVWSPRGDYIAFTKSRHGTFYIGVIKPDGSGERLLTSSFLDEGPTWAPNGRVIMFFREKPLSRGQKSSELFTVDLTGRNLRKIPLAVRASDPAWSGLNPNY
jgi:TolB protein